MNSLPPVASASLLLIPYQVMICFSFSPHLIRHAYNTPLTRRIASYLAFKAADIYFTTETEKRLYEAVSRLHEDTFAKGHLFHTQTHLGFSERRIFVCGLSSVLEPVL